MIRVAGIYVRRAALTKLALRLRQGSPVDRALAGRIAHAIDHNPELPLHADDKAALRAALRDTNNGFDELRGALA
jgi:hypothetical protein